MPSNYSYNLGRQANGQRIIQQIQRGAMPTIIAVNMKNSVGAALDSVGDQLTRVGQNLAQAITKNAVTDSYQKDANLQLARGAQRAILSGWRGTLPVRAPGYRSGSNPDKDRLHGVLGRVLASDSMIRGTTAHTISFLNVGTLNTEARHWYRVNYGAMGYKVNPKRAKAYPVTAEGHTLFVLQDEADPAPNSWLPSAKDPTRPSYISEGPRWFSPVYNSGPATAHGGGHRAALFTDLGFKYLGRNFYPTYLSMLNRYAESELGKIKLTAAGVDVEVDARLGVRPTVHGR